MARTLIDDFRISEFEHRLRAMVRRVVVGATEGIGILWQGLGYRVPGSPPEAYNNVELFQGIGFHARPAEGSQAEAIILHVGAEHEHPVMIATRDASAQVAIEPDETVVFTRKATIKITKDGDILITAKAGRTISADDGSGAVSLATKADLDALASYVHEHTHLGVTTGAGTSGAPPPTPIVPSAAGTSVLKGK